MDSEIKSYLEGNFRSEFRVISKNISIINYSKRPNLVNILIIDDESSNYKTGAQVAEGLSGSIIDKSADCDLVLVLVRDIIISMIDKEFFYTNPFSRQVSGLIQKCYFGNKKVILEMLELIVKFNTTKPKPELNKVTIALKKKNKSRLLDEMKKQHNKASSLTMRPYSFDEILKLNNMPGRKKVRDYPEDEDNI